MMGRPIKRPTKLRPPMSSIAGRNRSHHAITVAGLHHLIGQLEDVTSKVEALGAGLHGVVDVLDVMKWEAQQRREGLHDGELSQGRAN